MGGSVSQRGGVFLPGAKFCFYPACPWLFSLQVNGICQLGLCLCSCVHTSRSPLPIWRLEATHYYQPLLVQRNRTLRQASREIPINQSLSSALSGWWPPRLPNQPLLFLCFYSYKPGSSHLSLSELLKTIIPSCPLLDQYPVVAFFISQAKIQAPWEGGSGGPVTLGLAETISRRPEIYGPQRLWGWGWGVHTVL